LPLTTFTLFPYTTLFRSDVEQAIQHGVPEVSTEPSTTPAPSSKIENRSAQTQQRTSTGDIEIPVDVLCCRTYGTSKTRNTTCLEDRKSTRLNSSHVSISY